MFCKHCKCWHSDLGEFRWWKHERKNGCVILGVLHAGRIQKLLVSVEHRALDRTVALSEHYLCEFRGCSVQQDALATADTLGRRATI